MKFLKSLKEGEITTILSIITLVSITTASLISSIFLTKSRQATRSLAQEGWHCPGGNCNQCYNGWWWDQGCFDLADNPPQPKESNICRCSDMNTCVKYDDTLKEYARVPNGTSGSTWCGNDCRRHPEAVETATICSPPGLSTPPLPTSTPAATNTTSADNIVSPSINPFFFSSPSPQNTPIPSAIIDTIVDSTKIIPSPPAKLFAGSIEIKNLSDDQKATCNFIFSNIKIRDNNNNPLTLKTAYVLDKQHSHKEWSLELVIPYEVSPEESPEISCILYKNNQEQGYLSLSLSLQKPPYTYPSLILDVSDFNLYPSLTPYPSPTPTLLETISWCTSPKGTRYPLGSTICEEYQNNLYASFKCTQSGNFLIDECSQCNYDHSLCNKSNLSLGTTGTLYTYAIIYKLPDFKHLILREPEEIMEQLPQILHEATNGRVNVEIKGSTILEELPKKVDGFVLTKDEILKECPKYPKRECPDLQGEELKQCQRCHSRFDYKSLLLDDRLNLKKKIDEGTINHLWLFAPAYYGFKEHVVSFSSKTKDILGGCDISYDLPESNNSYIVMGFNYQVDLDHYLHDFGHLMERLLNIAYAGCSDLGSGGKELPRVPGDTTYTILSEANDWFLFQLGGTNLFGYRRVCGNTHSPPNARFGYDYNNPTPLFSLCEDFIQSFPNRPTDKNTLVSSTDWYKNPADLNFFWSPKLKKIPMWNDHISFLLWWFKKMPYFAGEKNSMTNNWWEYLYNTDTNFSKLRSMSPLSSQQISVTTQLDRDLILEISPVGNTGSSDDVADVFSVEGKDNTKIIVPL